MRLSEMSGMEWDQVKWVERNEISGMEWDQVEWVEQNEIKWNEWNGMRLSGIKWNEWNGMRLTENAMKLGKKKGTRDGGME